MYALSTLTRLFARHGKREYLGELVSQEQHMVQAAMWVKKQGMDQDVQLAALLHDVGHLVALDRDLPMMMEGTKCMGGKDHDKVGASYLRGLGLPERVCRLVEHHVDAKRYLVTIDDDYRLQLSSASFITLRHQGGKMSTRERQDFGKDPLRDSYLTLREAEEHAKDPELATPPIKEVLIPLLTPLEDCFH